MIGNTSFARHAPLVAPRLHAYMSAHVVTYPGPHPATCRCAQSYQHVYLALLYGLLAIKSVLVDDFTALAEGVIGSVRVKPLTRGEAALLWAGKALYCAWFLALPAACSGRSWAALAALWLTAEAVAGWTLAFMFQVHLVRCQHALHTVVVPTAKSLRSERARVQAVRLVLQGKLGCALRCSQVARVLPCQVKARVASSPSGDICCQVAHVVGDVEFLQADQMTGKVPRGWAAAQVATSADFAHGSWFWTHLSGGLNYQARAAGPCRPPALSSLWACSWRAA